MQDVLYVTIVMCLTFYFLWSGYNECIFWPLCVFNFHNSQMSRTNNKRVISTFKFGYPHLTLKEGPKVKSDQNQKICSP